ncbi:MAG: ABC transporter permease [Candidatus Marinimicrobia bacterium]|jgi:lipoprotein-releasing system permease protein|nr:ABC transporter permease [Candidatus Neomarinimicrobiota bacterium]
MNKNFLNWIALRYFRSKKKTGLISFTSYISIIGIALGAFAMLVALSVLNGFEAEITNRVIDIESHLRISGRNLQSAQIERVKEALTGVPVREIYPFVMKKSILSSEQMEAVVRIKAIESATLEQQLSGPRTMMRGGANFLSATSNLPGIVVGYQLADKLGVYPGDTLNVINPTSLGSGLNIPIIGQFAVTGVFQLDLFDYDENIAFIELKVGQEIFEMGDNYSGIDIRLENYRYVEKAKQQLVAQLGNGYDVASWEDLHRTLFGAMKLEKYGSFLALSFIILVAILNLTSALVMLIMEKIQEIGMLQALGMNQTQVRQIFLRLGFLIGSIGLTVGIGLALILCLAQQHFQFIPLPSVYYIPYLPVQVQWSDVLMIIGAGLIFIYCGTLYPSWRVGKLMPLEAIQYEK